MNEPIRVLDLFSGIGGFALAAEIANAMADAEQSAITENNNRREEYVGNNRREIRSVNSSSRRFIPLAHAEVEPFACSVYHRNFPDSVCFGGVENVTRAALLERCGALPDVVCGGFPCQPHSCAGKRLASADERDLWGECRRVLGDLRPRFALFENVAGLLTSERGGFFNRILSDLAALRYACQWQVVPASAVGAPHRRDRVWLLCWDELANSEQQRGCSRDSQRQDANHVEPSSAGSLLWPALSGQWPSRPVEPQHGWEPGRVVHSERGGCGKDGKQGGVGGVREERQDDASEASEPDMGNAASQRPSPCGAEPTGQPREASTSGAGAQAGQREVEPSLGLLPDGIPTTLGGTWPEVHNRVSQLKAAGNAIVPEVAAVFMCAILMMHNEEGKAV